jgi:hypothetical protein
VTIASPPTIQPSDGRAVFFVVEADRHQLADLARRVRRGELRVLIGAVRPLAETADAFASTNRSPGRTIIHT